MLSRKLEVLDGMKIIKRMLTLFRIVKVNLVFYKMNVTDKGKRILLDSEEFIKLRS